MITLSRDHVNSSPATRSRSRRRVWTILPLLALVLGFLAHALPPYLTLDSTRARLPVPAGFAPYYGLLVAHIAFGSIAMLTGCLQVWPWFRERYPAAHRQVGRIYVIGGVMPAAVVALVIGPFNPLGLWARSSNVLLPILWLTFTLLGFRAATQRRLTEHRRQMLRSVVLTFSIITNRVWILVWVALLTPRLHTTFGGNEGSMWQTIGGLTAWLGWLIPLAAVEWWLKVRGPATRSRCER